MKHDIYGFRLEGSAEKYEKWARSEYREKTLEDLRIRWQLRLKKRLVQPGYKELVCVTTRVESPNAAQISKDLPRTAPGHANLTWLLKRLERVLKTYSLRNPSLGYCQSMNFIVALFLSATDSESIAFWATAEICEVLLPGNTQQDSCSSKRVVSANCMACAVPGGFGRHDFPLHASVSAG